MSEQLLPTPGTFGENGNFLLERELGSGGMGGVYMGRDKMLDRPVAVKVMLREYGEDAEFLEKFKKEAQAAAKLIHPNIAQIYSYGICDGMPYIAMELCSGGSLYSVMNVNPGHSDITRVMKICQQTAQALQCASDQGFVHGDVKPENILLDANGNAKLVDFGLAAMQKDTDEIWGTPYYISPEKVRKEVVDFRADMYSLGGTLYHALTGVAPFEGEDSIAVVKKRFDGAPRKPSEIRPEITPAVDALVMKMLELKKEDRYPSFEALLEAFRSVLSTGLTQKMPADEAPQSGPAKRVGVGPRRMTTVRGRRTMMTKRPTAVKKTLEGEEGNEGALENAAKAESEDSDEDEGGGNLGLKVALFVVGGLLLIGAIIGGLIWFKASSAAAEKAEIAAQIKGGFDKAKEAIDDTVKKSLAFADEFDAFAKKAVDECQKPTDQLTKILPEDQAGMLKPATSKELLDAIASTNETPVATPAPVAPSPAVTNAATATTNAVAKAGVTNAPAAKAVAEKKPAEAPAAEQTPPPQVVITMNELWERAYSCQASAVRIRHQSRQIVKKASEADALKEVTRENMDKLAELSRSLVEMLDQMKTSKDVENVRKGITYIKSKGEKTVEQTVKRLRIEKLEAERKAKAEAAAEAEKERLAKLEEERKAKVDEEKSSIVAKFEAITAQGNFRQLDWKGAIRQLEAAKDEFKTAEGQLQADLEIRKVNDMKKVQDVFIKSLKGHVFKGKLRGAKVDSVSEKDLVLIKSDGKSKGRISWQKFYKDYPGNLNEIINQYVVLGRKNAKPALNLRDWADAMTGAALTMQLICSEVNGAVERAEALAKETVKQFPEYLKTAQEIFPDIKFEAVQE